MFRRRSKQIVEHNAVYAIVGVRIAHRASFKALLLTAVNIVSRIVYRNSAYRAINIALGVCAVPRGNIKCVLVVSVFGVLGLVVFNLFTSR